MVSASATQIIVRVDSLTSGLTASAVDLYLPGDYPGTPGGGVEGLPAAIKVVFVPQLVSLSTGTVSAAGSVITAAVWGVGPGDEVTLWDVTGGRDFCAKRSVTAYGQLECETIAGVVAPLELGVRAIVSGHVTGVTHPCAAAASTACGVQALPAQMTVASVTSSGTQITFAGTDFPVSADGCEAIFMGQVSDSCSIDSPGSAVATFADGVPTAAAATSPLLRFIVTGASHYAVVPADATITNPLEITGASAGLKSSFAGG